MWINNDELYPKHFETYTTTLNSCVREEHERIYPKDIGWKIRYVSMQYLYDEESGSLVYASALRFYDDSGLLYEESKPLNITGNYKWYWT